MLNNDDLDLVCRIKANEDRALKQLVDIFTGYLLKILMKLGFSREDSFEIANDTFYKAIKNIDRFDVQKYTKLSKWLVTIVKNTAIDRLRKEKKSILFESLEEREDKHIQHKIEPADSPKSKTILIAEDLLNKALQKLTTTDRRILLGRAYGEEHQEIARSIGKSENAVKVAYHRALLKLKEEYILLLNTLEDSSQLEALKANLEIEDLHEKTAN
jgi:RNA polymerase sigma-70 factor, ECF subfamily